MRQTGRFIEAASVRPATSVLNFVRGVAYVSENDMKRLFLFLPLFPAVAWSDDFPLYEGNEIVVTAARIPEPLDQSLEDVSVISQKDIQSSGAPDVLSVLRNLAGVEITQSGGIGKQSSIFMRGTNSDHVLVLLDGVRIDSATTGTAEVDQLMLDQIDRIEVVRGNASSLYGSSAIGGVIQIFTKKGAGKPNFNFSTGYGSYNSKRLSSGFGGVIGSNQFQIQASKYATDGIPAIDTLLAPAANPAADGYSNVSLSTNLSHRFNADHRLTFSGYQSRGNNNYANAFAASTSDVYNNVSSIQKLSLVEEDTITGNWSSRLMLADGKDNERDFLNGAQSDLFQTENQQASWQNTVALNRHARLVAGAEKLVQRVSSTTFFTQTKRNVNSLFAGYNADYGAQEIQANVRQDDYSDFGAANTWLMGYGYRFTHAWRATVNYSTAFKAPTFNDLYWPLQYGYQGNPNLQPERSHNAEAGLHYIRGGQKVDFVYFNNNIDNLISPNSAGTTMVNINQARIDGEELSYADKFGDTDFTASLTAQNPRDALTGQTLPLRAKFYSSLGISRQIGKFQLGGQWQHSGSRDATNSIVYPAVPVTLQSYNLVNLTADYAWTKHWHANASISNLFNQNYMLVYPYNTYGRTFFVSVSYHP